MPILLFFGQKNSAPLLTDQIWRIPQVDHKSMCRTFSLDLNGGGGQHSALKSLRVHLVSKPEPDQAQSANEGQPFFSKNQGTASQ